MSDRKVLQDPFIRKVAETIRRHRLLPRGRTVGVAVSGGPDSVALLAALAGLAPQWRCRLAVLHVNHGLRGRESGEDARFVRRLALQYGLAFRATKLDLGKPSKSRPIVSEELLRGKRYAAIERLARESGATAVALGHHRDDLAETVLMHLLRGSGPAGLGGFAPKSQLGRMTYVRPLYDCTRAEVLEFLQRRRLRWREDRTNRDTRWLRNRIRHELLPTLEREYNPRLRDLLADNARWFRADEAHFEAQARKILGLSLRKGRLPRSFPLARLGKMALSLLARVLRVWIMAVTRSKLPPPGRQIEELIALIERPTKHGEVRCAEGVTFVVRDNNLKWRRPMAGKSARAQSKKGALALEHGGNRYPLVCLPRQGRRLPVKTHCETIAMRGQTVRLELRCISRTRSPARFDQALARARSRTRAGDLEQYFDADRIEEPLILRNRRPGDRFHPLGAMGSRKLKELLIDVKVPAPLRSQLLLVCDAKTVLWVVGLRTSQSARLTHRTRNILSVAVRIQPNKSTS